MALERTPHSPERWPDPSLPLVEQRYCAGCDTITTCRIRRTPLYGTRALGGPRVRPGSLDVCTCISCGLWLGTWARMTAHHRSLARQQQEFHPEAWGEFNVRAPYAAQVPN